MKPGLSFAAFLRGGPALSPGSSVPWPWALLAGMVFLFAADRTGAIVGPLVGSSGSAPAPSGAAQGLPPPIEWLVMQLAIVGMVALALGRHGVRELRLGPPAGGTRAVVYAMVLMAALSSILSVASDWLRPEDAARDLQQIKAIARGPDPLLNGLSIGLGAPLAEELLFRGLVLLSLAATRLGFWPAAIPVAVVWTLLHWQYTWTTLATVLVFGLYLSWTLWRTGSLWTPIICHAAYNSAVFAWFRWGVA